MKKWTDEERRLLVECAYHATIITGHELGDISKELARLVTEYKASKVDERGRKTC